MRKTTGRLVALFITVILCLSIIFVEHKRSTLACRTVDITIQDHPGQSFISSKEILESLKSIHKNIDLEKNLLKEIDIYAIHHQLKNHPLIKRVLVYKTCSGGLKIWIESKYFIGRLISLAEPNGWQVYVDEMGSFIKIKGLLIVGILIISRKNIDTNQKKLTNKKLLKLLHYLDKDAFWKRQITSLEIKDNGTVTFGTQIGGHTIEFGCPDQIEHKFEKLRLFYKEVIPYKGWHTYSRINLAFKNQLICE